MSPFIIEPSPLTLYPSLQKGWISSLSHAMTKNPVSFTCGQYSFPHPLRERDGDMVKEKKTHRRIRATSLTKGGTGWVALLSLAMTKNPVSFTCGQCSFPLPLRERVRVRGVMNMFNVLPIT